MKDKVKQLVNKLRKEFKDYRDYKEDKKKEEEKRELYRKLFQNMIDKY